MVDPVGFEPTELTGSTRKGTDRVAYRVFGRKPENRLKPLFFSLFGRKKLVLHGSIQGTASRVVRGGGDGLRKVALAVIGTLVSALMLSQSVLASGGDKSNSMYVIDREGDLGKFWYPDYQGSHMLGDPYSWWSGNSPINNAGYLDMVMGWIVVDRKTVTLGMQLASPISDESTLPEGIKAVQWSWFFTPAPIEFLFDYEVLVFWDGLEFTAFQIDRRAFPFTVTPLDSFEVSGDTLTVQVGAAILKNQVGWFFETTAYEKPPPSVTGERSMAGWGSPDVTDLVVGQDPAWWPSVPLP